MNLMNLLSAAFAWFKVLFKKDKNQSSILKILVENYEDPELNVIKNKEYGEKALEIVRNLDKSQKLTGQEKAELFNQLFSEYLKEIGKVIAKSALNLLRELAVTTIKVAATAAITGLLAEPNNNMKKVI